MRNPFPARSPAFLAFVAPADRFDQVWRLVLGLVSIAVLWALPVVVIVVWLTFSANGIWRDLLPSAQGNAAPAATAAIMVSSLFAYPALWLALKSIHHRQLQTLFGSGRRVNWRHFILTALIAAGIGSAGLGLSLINDSAVPNLDFARWLVLLPAMLPVVFLQTASEELLFRGYLMQQLGSRFASRWLWWVLPAVLFGFLHFDRATFLQNAPLVVIATFLIGLIAGDLTARTGNLGAAMGLHFANNLFAVLVLGMPGPASGLALFVADVDLGDIAAVRAGLLGQITILSGVYIVYLFIASRRTARQLQSASADFN